MPWTMGREEEQSRGKKGGQSQGDFKKLGSKVRELWRTTTSEERVGAPVGRRNLDTIKLHPEGSNTSPQYINLLEPRVETSVALTPDGSRSSANLGTGSLGASKVAQTPEEGQACRQYISTPHQSQAVSSPLSAARAGRIASQAVFRTAKEV